MGRVDKDGRFWNNVAGALIGAVAEAATQVAVGMVQGQSFSDAVSNIDYVDVAVAAGEGFLTSGGSAIKTIAKSAVKNTLKTVATEGVVAAVSEVDPNLGQAVDLISNVAGGGKKKKYSSKNAKKSFREAEPASPALKDNPYSPREVDKRRSQRRKDLGVEPDPDAPIPDQPPGKNIKDGVHTSSGKDRHSTGERNVSSKEEHSRVAKGNRRGTERKRK